MKARVNHFEDVVTSAGQQYQIGLQDGLEIRTAESAPLYTVLIRQCSSAIQT